MQLGLDQGQARVQQQRLEQMGRAIVDPVGGWTSFASDDEVAPVLLRLYLPTAACSTSPRFTAQPSALATSLAH